MDNSFVGRHPILDAQLQITGYELLFRTANAKRASFSDGDQATLSVLLNTLMDIGLERVVHDKKAFVNITRNLLVGDEIACLPPDRIVLEILEDVQPDDEVLAAVKRLSQLGFTIALDDYVYREQLDPLLDLVDIVKLDLPQIRPDDLPILVRNLRQRGVSVLAEKVETQDEFRMCKEIGCDYFQGYFFCKPHTLAGRRVTGNAAAFVRLLSGLQNQNITPPEIERLLCADANLCFKLLAFANSAQISAVRRIDSIRHAASLLGVSRIRSVASMMLMAGLAEGKPQELLSVAMIRAKMCESIGLAIGETNVSRMFTAGMLSVFDAMLDMSMDEVVRQLPLNAELTDALLYRQGIVGEVLQCVLDYESGQFPETFPRGIPATSVQDCYLEAIEWAGECMRQAEQPVALTH